MQTTENRGQQNTRLAAAIRHCPGTRKHRPFKPRTCPPCRGSSFSNRDLRRVISLSPRLTPAPRSAKLGRRGGGLDLQGIEVNEPGKEERNKAERKEPGGEKELRREKGQS